MKVMITTPRLCFVCARERQLGDRSCPLRRGRHATARHHNKPLPLTLNPFISFYALRHATFCELQHQQARRHASLGHAA
jgi:hypothetical protein